MNTLEEQFRDNLRIMRLANNYTGQQQAILLSTPIGTYLAWETGKAVPKPSKLAKVCAVFNVTVDDMLKTDLRPRIIKMLEASNPLSKASTINEIINHNTKSENERVGIKKNMAGV